LLSLPVNAYLLAFIFFATLSGYNAYWLISRVAFNNTVPFSTIINSAKSSLLVVLFAVAGMLYSFMQLHLVMYNIVITFIFLALYAVPLLPIPQLHFTRRAGFLKTILLALAWTMVTILVPLQLSITDMSTAGILLFCNRLFFMLTLCIIFDKRDATIDKIRGLQSLATDIRPHLLNIVIAVVLILYAGTSAALYWQGIGALQVAALFVTGIVTGWMYFRSLRQQGYLFYYFLVDGLMFLSGLLTLLATIS
jgi:4-hydroxybenzoate polyprenyltransferase